MLSRKFAMQGINTMSCPWKGTWQERFRKFRGRVQFWREWQIAFWIASERSKMSNRDPFWWGNAQTFDTSTLMARGLKLVSFVAQSKCRQYRVLTEEENSRKIARKQASNESSSRSDKQTQRGKERPTKERNFLWNTSKCLPVGGNGGLRSATSVRSGHAFGWTNGGSGGDGTASIGSWYRGGCTLSTGMLGPRIQLAITSQQPQKNSERPWRRPRCRLRNSTGFTNAWMYAICRVTWNL